MKNLDSLTLKFFFDENKDFLSNAVVQKIQMPTRKEILLYLRNNGENRKFYININPKYPHICFINDKKDFSIKIPKTPPMFCMQLRKYIEGEKIQNSVLIEYERILEFHFSITDEFGINDNLVFAIELMGKYSNTILYNKKTKLILGSAHNVSPEKSQVREIYGGIEYIYPKKQNKKDILKTAFSEYLELKASINENFYYFSKPFLQFIKDISENDYELFSNLQNSISNPSLLKKFWNDDHDFNSIILNYYSKKVNFDLIQTKQNKLLKILNLKLKKYETILSEEFDTTKFENYKHSADLILKYIYLIKEKQETITLEGHKIKLDPKKTISQNLEHYYKLYSKLKSAKNIIEKRKQDAKVQIEYLKGVIFDVLNASDISVLDEIEEEITDEKTSDKKTYNIESFQFMGYTIFIGKNNKQNDYLIRKLSSPEDIWLHALNCPSGHSIIKNKDKKTPPNEVLLFASNLVKKYSPLKNSNKASIIYTKRKYIKRPPNTHLGYVTYYNEEEIVI